MVDRADWKMEAPDWEKRCCIRRRLRNRAFRHVTRMPLPNRIPLVALWAELDASTTA